MLKKGINKYVVIFRVCVSWYGIVGYYDGLRENVGVCLGGGFGGGDRFIC